MIRKIAKEASKKYPFGPDDFFQQVIGSALLSAPFLFTEEIWILAFNISGTQAFLSAVLTLILGHGILYIAKQDRDFEQERKVGGFTLRYISLMTVTFGTILLLMALTSTPQTFGYQFSTAVKVMAMISIFSVIGAASADSLI